MQGNFTGRHMLLIMLGFFGVVIAVNVTMAVFARSSWTGLVVPNTYIASQEFNGKVADARAQKALGWQAELTLAGGEALLALSGADGRALAMDGARLVFRNPATDAQDREIALAPRGMAMAAAVELHDGQWVVEIDAEVPGHETWRDTRRVVISGGELK